MSTDSALIEDEPIIEADLGDNGGKVAFRTLEEAKNWVDREVNAWKRYEIPGISGSAVSYILERQIQLPSAISESLEKVADLQGDELRAALESINEQFEQYADYRSIYSASRIGDEILTMKHSDRQLLAIGALASNLGIPAVDILRKWGSNESDLSVVLSGYALCHPANVVRRSDLPEHKCRVEKQLNEFEYIARQARNDQREMKKVATSAIEESSGKLKEEQSNWVAFSGTAQSEWKAIRNAFESQLRLESPVKYWRDQADTTSKVAKRSLCAFAVIAFAIIGVLVVFGPGFLEDVSASSNAGPFTTLAFVSIPALTALWGLKHVARLFVTNVERNADARLRETMTTTFLALTKEGAATVDENERLLILEALFRPPAPAPSDEGHWGGLSAILSRRSS